MNHLPKSIHIQCLIFLMVLFQACPGDYGYKYHTGVLPTSPVNFEEINSPYDDYNATAPTLGETFPLCFSSSRSSKGEQYDIIYKLISIEFSKTTGELSVFENTASNLDIVQVNANLNNAVSRINTSSDELGPYLIPVHDYRPSESATTGRYRPYYLLYSNDENGNQDIYFTDNTETENYEDPLPVAFLNSEADDAYPCFNEDRSTLYFTSNRDGNFDIFKAITDPDQDLAELLGTEEAIPVEKDSILSSDQDDKCPYITYNNTYYPAESVPVNMMVFASNREGGFGGYDLYYSLFDEGVWTEPVNFGAAINTTYDEYRPIIRPLSDFSSDFMLFSSNRPGGKGGFDLYYVGVRMLKDAHE